MSDLPRDTDLSVQGRRILIPTILIFCGLSVWMAWVSEGFLEADGVTHYLVRHFALERPVYWVDIWSRPFCVFLYSVASFWGLFSTRLMSLVVALGVLGITILITRAQKLTSTDWAGFFLLIQPLFFAHSFSELTELPFAGLSGLVFLAYQHRKFGWMALLSAVSPMARPEGFGVILLTTIALILHRKPHWILVLPLGLIVWSWAGWQLFGGPKEYPWYRWLIENWPYSSESTYGQGSFFRLTVLLPAVIGPFAFPMIWLGAIRCLKVPDVLRSFLNDHGARCRLLIPLIPIGVLGVHSFLWMMGKMASNGEPRYLLIVAPFWAILATMGWEKFSQHLRIRHPIRWAVIGALVPVTANLFYPVIPLGMTVDHQLARQVRHWLDSQTDHTRTGLRIASASPYVFLELNLDRLDQSKVVDSSQQTVIHAPQNVLFIWDSIFSGKNADQGLVVTQDMLESHGWVLMNRVDEPKSGRYALIYRSPIYDLPAVSKTDTFSEPPPRDRRH